MKGGARPGSGRPALAPGSKKVPVSYRLDRDLVEWLRQQPEPANQLVEAALNKLRDGMENSQPPYRPMRIVKNPNGEKIAEYCRLSEHAAAKWVKDTQSGDVFVWPAGSEQHAQVAKSLGITEFEKGLFTVDPG